MISIMTGKNKKITSLIVGVVIILFVAAAAFLLRPHKNSLAISERAQQEMQIMTVALEDYRQTCGQYPTTEQGLKIMAEEVNCKGKGRAPLLAGVGNDPWNTPWIYNSDGESFKLGTLGADHQEGGEGLNQDLWTQETQASSQAEPHN